MKKQDYIFNICMLIVAVVSLFVAMASYYETIRASEAADHSAEIANESLNTLIKVSKASDDLVKWYQVPHPFMTYAYNVNYINGRVNIEIFPVKGLETLPLGVPVPIKVTLYNSGRAPLTASELFINLTADNISNTFPFKIYRIVTPLEKMYYDPEMGRLIRSYESNSVLDWGPNEKEFPPHFINGEIYYTNRVSFDTDNIKPKKETISVLWWETQKDLFGPFEIGTIEPDKKAEIEIWLFAIAEGKGNLSIIVDSENLKSISYNYNNNISIDIPLRAVGR